MISIFLQRILRKAFSSNLLQPNNNSIKHMNKKIVVDCRRVLAKKELDAEYYAIGIGKNE